MSCIFTGSKPLIFLLKVEISMKWHVLYYAWFLVLNVILNNISVISWRSVLLVEETGENHRPVCRMLYYTSEIFLKIMLNFISPIITAEPVVEKSVIL